MPDMWWSFRGAGWCDDDQAAPASFDVGCVASDSRRMPRTDVAELTRTRRMRCEHGAAVGGAGRSRPGVVGETTPSGDSSDRCWCSRCRNASTDGRRARTPTQCGSTSSTPSVTMTTAMIASRIRHTRAREHSAEESSAVGEAEEPDDARMPAPAANAQRPSPWVFATDPSRKTVSRYTCGFSRVSARHVNTATVRVERAGRVRVGAIAVADVPLVVDPSVEGGGRPGPGSAVSTTSVLSLGDEGLAAGLHGPRRCEHPVPDEEGGADPSDHVDEPRHCVSTAPTPETPTMMRAKSLTAQIAATANTCSRRMPCRSTNTFCAPMATMSERPRPRPASAEGEVHGSTLRGSGHSVQLEILHRH